MSFLYFLSLLLQNSKSLSLTYHTHRCYCVRLSIRMFNRLSNVQRAVLAPYFGMKAIRDPRRGDMVAALGDTLGTKAATRMLKVRKE